MLIEAAICDIDQISVELVLRNSGLISGSQKNGPTLQVKRKGNPPNAFIGSEAKFFHVRVL